MPASVMYSVRSSAMRLVSVVTSTRPPLLDGSRHSASRSSTWLLDRADLVTGSISPVGRMTCSAKAPPVRSISHGPGVALTKTVCGAIALPLLEFQRPVVDAGRQAEAEFVQDGLAREVAAGTSRRSGHGDVAFVHDQQRVFRQVFEQGRRRLARFAAGKIAASSSRCRCRRRSSPSSRCRIACAAPAAAPPAACRRHAAPAAAPSARALIESIACCSVGRGVT